MISAFDSAATPLGPASGWPQSLRTALGICLGSRLPTLICWGPEQAVLFNDAARALLGAAWGAELLGKPLRLVWPEAWPILGPLLAEAPGAGAPAWPDELPLGRNGAQRPLACSCSPILDEAGAVAGVYCTFGEAPQAEGEAQQGAFAELSFHMAWALGPDGEITFLSQKWYDYTGISLDEVRASGWEQALHPDERAAVGASFRDALARAEPYTIELRLRARDGGYRWHLNRAAPVRDAGGAVRRWVGVTFDIDERKRAEEALRASEERYRLLTHMLTSVVWQADASGAFAAPQPEWAAFTGQGWEAHRGWGWAEALHPDDREPLLERLRRALAEGAAYEARGRIWRSSAGAYHHFVARAAPLRGADGSIGEWLGTLTDTHEQEQRERDARFMADLAERIRLATGPDALLAQVAAAVAEYLHVRRCLIIDIDTASDRAVVRAEHCRGAPSVPREYRVSSYSPIARGEMEAGRMIVNSDAMRDPRTADLYAGTYGPAGERSYIAVPLMRDRRWNGTLWVSDDVPRPWEERERSLLETVAERAWLAAEKLRADEALRAYAEQLLELYAAAQDAVRVRDQFLSIAAHELKTPLTALLGYSQTLLRRAVREGTLGERDQRILRQTAEQALRLDRLIDTLLDVGRIESGRLSIERRPLDLSALARRCVEALRETLEQHAVVLSGAGAPLMIQGDELRLEQVLQNLLGNAVKYSPGGGAVRVSLSREGDAALITVADEGVGIPQEALPQLFQRFYRVGGAATRHIAGLGIGLYVVKEIVALHGGTVTVESAEGAGSTFTVRLPVSEETYADPDHRG